LLCVTIAVPADPEKPEINSRRASVGAMYSDECASSEGTTRDEHQSAYQSCRMRCSRTVYIYLVVFHQLSQPLQATRGVYSLHVDGLAKSRCCSEVARRGPASRSRDATASLKHEQWLPYRQQLESVVHVTTEAAPACSRRHTNAMARSRENADQFHSHSKNLSFWRLRSHRVVHS